jgi:peptidoglycan/LPS O-acetylase OafA/YrhL
MKDKQENYFIDFLRFIFSMCILFYHSWYLTGRYGKELFKAGYLAVDFYFIVTGYLMINSMKNNTRKDKNKKTSMLNDTVIFVWNKINKLIPALLLTFIIGVIYVYGFGIFLNPSLLFSNKLMPELFQFGILGYKYYINDSWWYISSMLFVIALLYPLTQKFKNDYFIYVAPLIIIITLGIVNSFGIYIDDPAKVSFFLENGFYKALIYIPLGNISYFIAEKIRSKNFTKNKIILLSIVEILLYIFFVCDMHFKVIGTFIFGILMTLNVSLTFSNVTYSKKIFKHSFWKKLGLYGFYVFLCNVSIRRFIVKRYKKYNLTYKQLFIRFVILSLVTALFIYIMIEIVYKKIILKKYREIKNKG